MIYDVAGSRLTLMPERGRINEGRGGRGKGGGFTFLSSTFSRSFNNIDRSPAREVAPVLFNSHVGCLPDRYRYRNTPILLDTRVLVVVVVVGSDEEVIVR